MKFTRAKKDGIQCHECQTFILRGEDMAQSFVNTPEYHRVLSFHPQCYLNWYNRKFHIKFQTYKTGNGLQPPLKKLGRPVKYEDPDTVRELKRLRSSRSYHKKWGNEKQVQVCNQKIKEIEDRQKAAEG